MIMRGASDLAIVLKDLFATWQIQLTVSGDCLMTIRWLFIFLVTSGTVCTASAQVADIAGVLPGYRWVCELTDEISGDLKFTTTVFVLDVTE